tara:strand:+ start:2779 stop:3024 length:246 start_codon:yes stop_codon:yes gene_type:complete
MKNFKSIILEASKTYDITLTNITEDRCDVRYRYERDTYHNCVVFFSDGMFHIAEGYDGHPSDEYHSIDELLFSQFHPKGNQ